jgi:hypothetical protein
MLCLVFVKFLPGGSLAPEEFFARIKARWSWMEGKAACGDNGKSTSAPTRSAVCIAEYDSLEQFAIDLAVMPGAGISNIEVAPVSAIPDYGLVPVSTSDIRGE